MCWGNIYIVYLDENLERENLDVCVCRAHAPLFFPKSVKGKKNQPRLIGISTNL